MLFKYSGKYVKICFNMKITFQFPNEYMFRSILVILFQFISHYILDLFRDFH